MKKTILLMVLLGITAFGYGQDARQLIAEAIEATGGKQNFYNLGGVTYDYDYKSAEGSIELKSQETYDFDGEKSHARYTRHSVTAPEGKRVVEGYDGNECWVSTEGVLSMNKDANQFARFIRKTNYYWFSMFFKLLDDGVNHEYIGAKSVNDQAYDLVRITFGDGIGDAQDTYVLYINKETKLIDQFLFTITAFGVTEPNLMMYEYETINGIEIGTKRKYVKSNWEGEILEDTWSYTNWTNIKFGKPEDQAMFYKPNN